MRDWGPVAALLAESQGKPIIVLDAHGRIALVNSAVEQLFATHRYDVVGQGWVETFVPPELAPLARSRLSEALRGSLRSYDCEVMTQDGRRLTLTLAVGLVASGHEPALVMVVESVAVRRRLGQTYGSRDIDLELSADLVDFGTIRRLSVMGASAPELVGQRCYKVLHGRDHACRSCPVLSSDGHGWPRTTIRRAREDQGQFVLVTVDQKDKGTVHVSVRWLSDSVLGGLLRTRITEIAAGARLSRREQDVLLYLVLGRSLEDVATILGIGVRTVKFHQSNILEKTGADSRVDLIRLLF